MLIKAVDFAMRYGQHLETRTCICLRKHQCATNLIAPIISAARRRNYGRNKVGGALMFSETNAGTRFQVLAVSHGEIDGFDEHWFADAPAIVDGLGRVTNIYLSSGVSCVILKAETG